VLRQLEAARAVHGLGGDRAGARQRRARLGHDLHRPVAGRRVRRGFDHIVYGWIFFALVMAAVLGAWWRWFDRSPDAPLIDAAAIKASPLLARLAMDR
jgi:hypothetical protein